MRFPKLTELDAEQKAIYNGAPPTKSILVIGPPGTGKTVMAFHRAAYLRTLSTQKKDPGLAPRVIMYGKVLSKYTSTRGGVAEGVPTSTMHSWMPPWWRGMFKRNPPTKPEDKWQFDWERIMLELAARITNGGGRVHWGHLLIDEGQDFPKEMYEKLAMVGSLVAQRSEGTAPALTVFADENQRLNPDTNSTLAEIQAALSLPDDRVYKLRKNYRCNTQIAKFARHYYVGLASGRPELPDRKGKMKPRVVLASALEVLRDRIARYAKNNSGSDVGVICSDDSLRKKIFNSLSHRLKDERIVVQTYANNARALHPPEKLRFDEGGSVTVLNYQSSKGLEFDAVFLADPFRDRSGAGDEFASMQLYVMASRARDYLELLILNRPNELEQKLPPADLYEQIEE